MYIGNESRETRHFVAERPDLLRHFFGLYQLEEGCVALSDNGNSFYEDVLCELGLERHICYPAVVHQFLSANDNRYHGSAKKVWRETIHDYSNDVLSSVALLRQLDYFVKDASTWFSTNLQLDDNRPSLEGVQAIIKGCTFLEVPFFRDCLRSMHLQKYHDARGGTPKAPKAPKGLDCGLDGVAWEN